jgi:hypothetical protein
MVTISNSTIRMRYLAVEEREAKQMYKVNDTPFFKLDDSNNPGYARVLLKKIKFKILGYPCWQAKVTEIVKPSNLHNVKVGTTLTVSEKLLTNSLS